MTIAVALLGGILLGLRWGYVVLLPSTLIVGVMLFVAGGLSWAAAAQVFLACTVIQAGYLCGVALRGAPQTTTGNFGRTVHRY
jgi:hypothetical protein